MGVTNVWISTLFILKTSIVYSPKQDYCYEMSYSCMNGLHYRLGFLIFQEFQCHDGLQTMDIGLSIKTLVAEIALCGPSHTFFAMLIESILE